MSDHDEPGDDKSPHHDADGTQAPLGGSETTADELQADNEAEEDTLRTLEGEAPTG